MIIQCLYYLVDCQSSSKIQYKLESCGFISPSVNIAAILLETIILQHHDKPKLAKQAIIHQFNESVCLENDIDCLNHYFGCIIYDEHLAIGYLNYVIE